MPETEFFIKNGKCVINQNGNQVILGEDELYQGIKAINGKSHYDHVVDDDIEAVVEGMNESREDIGIEPLNISSEEYRTIRDKVSNYCYSDYNNYIESCIIETVVEDL